MAKEYGGPVNKHQQLAQTGHAEGYAKGGSVHHSKGGHMKHERSEHHGHGKHGHKEPHEHHTHPGAGHSGHTGDGIHSLVHAGKNTDEHVEDTYTESIETDGGGGKHHQTGDSSHSTGATRNRI